METIHLSKPLTSSLKRLTASFQGRWESRDRSRRLRTVLMAAALLMVLAPLVRDGQAQSVSWRLRECSGRRRITAVVIGQVDATLDLADRRVAQDLLAQGQGYALQTCRKLTSGHIQKYIQVFLDTPQAPRGWWQWPPVRGYFAWGNRFHYINTLAPEHEESAAADHGGPRRLGGTESIPHYGVPKGALARLTPHRG